MFLGGIIGILGVLLLVTSPSSPAAQKWTQHNGQRWGFGYGNPFNFQARLDGLFRVPKTVSGSRWDNLWAGIGDYDGEVPTQQLGVQFAYGYTVRPNDTVTAGLLSHRPHLTWPADPNSLYTVMIVDNGIERLLPQQFIHWMVVNIPGSNVQLGSEVMDYITPFSIEFKDGKIDKDSPGHSMLVLVYKQPGEIMMEETRRGCSAEMLTSINNNGALARKYNLELVAGNFFHVPYSGQSTEDMICRLTRCTKQPFPLDMPGINDGDECQPRRDVMDVTLRGPVKGKEALYSKYVSLFSPVSFLNLILSTYPVLSTGIIREFRAVEGEFDGGASLAETLDGDVNVAMLVYQGAEETVQLFTADSPQVRDTLGAVLPALATSGDYKVLLVQPHDQDWDVNIVARNPGNIIEMEMVRVKEGQEEKFQTLRNSCVARARNNKHVMDVQTFDVVNGVLESLPADNLFNFDSTRNELMMTFYASSEEREKAFANQLTQGLGKKADYYSTFDCIACTVINTDLDPTYYGPFLESP
eukprot:GFUD01006106.1.p1 GENE.GFUD01006106.1~~GFUD01006106.1.p1  ORF type:complete len:527 (-),score=118.65 GFUD01006106.1:49-1629(-)